MEFMENRNLKANTKHITAALNIPSAYFQKDNNYEILEVLGDSVLKYLTSCYLVYTYPKATEDKLT